MISKGDYSMENNNIIESILATTFFENEELFKKEREYPTSDMERYLRFRHFIREMDETDVEIFKILSKKVTKECCENDE